MDIVPVLAGVILKVEPGVVGRFMLSLMLDLVRITTILPFSVEM